MNATASYDDSSARFEPQQNIEEPTVDQTQGEEEEELEVKPFNSTVGPFWPGYEFITELIVL